METTHTSQKNSNSWIQFLNTGVQAEFPFWMRNRIRMLNGISLITAIIFLGYALFCLSPMAISNADFKYGFIISITVFLLHLFFILLNKVKANTFACHLYTFTNIAMFALLYLTQSKLSAIEYFLFPVSIVCMLFFTDVKVIVGYVLLTLVTFFVCKDYKEGIHPTDIHTQIMPVFMLNHLAIFIIIFSIVVHFKKQNQKQESILEEQQVKLSEEKKKSDDLLLNILPEEIAEELKETGLAKARSFPQVTVMFTDFKNFTAFTENMNPVELVKSIDYYFSAFDKIIVKHGLEKIKTIGDSYMCAGGLPEETPDHAHKVILAALEIQEFMAEFKKAQQAKGESWFELRLGINTGPVVAGIVGIKKFAYDIWGDTVNIAALMEQSGEVGKVNISETTYAIVKNDFDCSHRGKVATKNKGEADMYFVEPKRNQTS